MNPALVERPSRTLIQDLIQQSTVYPTMVMGDLELQGDSEQVFAVTMRCEERIVAGAIGLVSCDWAYVETVWVDDKLRGQGIGKRLMLAVESYSAQLGLNGIQLYTTGFQAPDFYPRLGYQTIGKLPNRPLGYSATYFSKTDFVTDQLIDEFEIENPVTDSTFEYLEGALIQHAQETEPIVAHERVFMLYDSQNAISGGLFGHEFWGWLDVHLCYATTSYGVNQLLDNLERYCDATGQGIVLPTYEDWQGELLQMRGYRIFGTFPNRPTGNTCTMWIRPQLNM